MISAYTGIPCRQDVAMTGEITLRGKVLPVGGIREKVLAAHRAGIKKILLPIQNEPDLEEIPAAVRKDIGFVLIDHVKDALPHILTKSIQKKPAKTAAKAAAASAKSTKAATKSTKTATKRPQKKEA
jgi:ATP-dependent Lon protease